MSYATVEDFIAYFGENEALELTNLENPLAISVDTVLLQKALDHATSEIDVYISGNYKLPLTSVPSILVYDCCEIARFRLDKLHTRDDVTERYNLVIQRLRDISKGVINLGLDKVTGLEVLGEVGEPTYYSALPVFTLESLKDF